MMTTITQTWSVLNKRPHAEGTEVHWIFKANAGNGFADHRDGLSVVFEPTDGLTDDQVLQFVWDGENEINKTKIEEQITANVQVQLDTNNPASVTPAHLK